MCVCVCVFVHACIYVHMCVCMCEHAYTCILNVQTITNQAVYYITKILCTCYYYYQATFSWVRHRECPIYCEGKNTFLE